MPQKRRLQLCSKHGQTSQENAMSGSFLVRTLIDAKLSDSMSAHHSGKNSFQILITKPIGVYIQNFKKNSRYVMGRG